MRTLRILVVLLAVAAGLWLLPTAIGGGASYVVTTGNSMEPGFQTGDLAVLHRADSYNPGDVVAYRSARMDTIVMHRIVAVNDGEYSFKGDNNIFIDPETPSSSEFIGALVVRIPQGGAWLEHLASPAGLGVAAFILLIAGTGTASLSRRNRRPGRPSMSRKTTSRPSFSSFPAPVRIGGAVVVLSAALGVAIGLPAWFGGPVERTAIAETPSTGKMSFSYQATVAQSPVYDGTTVTSPDPVFRNLTESLEIGYVYNGEPGSVQVTAELSAGSGWHTSIPLSPPSDFTDDGYEGSVLLDLDALEARARAAAEVTGIPAGPITVSVTPHIETAAGHSFSPALHLVLAPLQVSLKDGPAALTVRDTATVAQPAVAARLLQLGNWSISAMDARVLSLALLLIALLGGVIVLLGGKHAVAAGERAVIRRRYGSLLVSVGPVPLSGRRVFDVADFESLVKLAERFGSLILHWQTDDGETFLVQDDSATYRYQENAHDAESSRPAAPSSDSGATSDSGGGC